MDGEVDEWHHEVVVAGGQLEPSARVDEQEDQPPEQLTFLGLLFVRLATLVDGMYAAFAGLLSHRLRSSARSQRYLQRAVGGVYLTLAGVAVMV